MKYAFLHKNFREFNFERKVIFLAHLATLVFCFFPWLEINPAYEAKFYYNAFQGPGFLIGIFIFVISLVIVFLFLDRLFERELIKFPFSENWIYYVASIEQVILLILVWSVLNNIGNGFIEHNLRYGIFLAFVAQISALVATFLNHQLDKQHQVREFFNHPDK